MGKACDTMKQLAIDMFHWIYPRKIEFPECTHKLLEGIYPTIDWNTVTFYGAMPWVFRLGPQEAITIPDTYGLRNINIYIKSGYWNPCGCDGLRVPIHEGFHVLQYRNIAGGWGIGFFRPYIIAYLSCGVHQGGDRQNYLEIPAYKQAWNGTRSVFDSCCHRIAATGKVICDCSTTPPGFDQSALDDLINHCPEVVQTDSGINFWKVIFACTPGVKLLANQAKRLLKKGHSFDWHQKPNTQVDETSETLWKAAGRFLLFCLAPIVAAGLIRLGSGLWPFLWFGIWALVTAVVAILKPIIEILLLMVDGILWVVTGILYGVDVLGGCPKID